MKPLFVARRNENNPLPIRRPPRLHIYSAFVGQLLRLPGSQIQQPQFHRILLIRHIHNALPVRRPVRLIVVSRSIRKLLRLVRINPLPPERPGHRILHFLRVRRPSHAARPASQLRQIHFAKVIRMRQVNLRQHRPPLRDSRTRPANRYTEEEKSFLQQGFQAKPAFVSGNSRMRFPVAAKIALHSAGAIAGNPGSPIPPGAASLSTMCTYVSRGAEFMRATGNESKFDCSIAPFAAVISPHRAILAPITAAPSNWFRAISGFTTVPASSAESTRVICTFPASLICTCTTEAAYVKKLRCTAMPIPNPLPFFRLPQPAFSAASCATRLNRAVSIGYCS